MQDRPALIGKDITERAAAVPAGRAQQQRAHRDDVLHGRRAQRPSPTSPRTWPPAAPCAASCRASRSSSTARSSPTRRSTTSSTPRASTAATAPRSRATSPSTAPRRWPSQINSGAIPINLEVISQKQVSATLGKQSLRQGLIAGLDRPRPGDDLPDRLLPLARAGRRRGPWSSTALLFYAVALLVPITLTLPGIAGIILTIGVAADANVVIFERVREEARAGQARRGPRCSTATRRASARSSTPTS